MAIEETPDRLIGANLLRLRGERSQASVADAMRKLGHKWSQATVWAVEKGERPLRLSEAVELAHVLRIDVTALVSPGESSRASFRLRAAGTAAWEALSRFYEAAAHLADARDELQASIDHAFATTGLDSRDAWAAVMKAIEGELKRAAGAVRAGRIFLKYGMVETPAGLGLGNGESLPLPTRKAT